MSLFPAHDPAVPIRQHASPERWQELLGGVLRSAGLPSEGLAPCAAGSDVVWATPTHVVKMTTLQWTDEIAAEAANLRAVAGRLTVPTADVVATGELQGWAWVIQTRLAGRPLARVWSDLGRADHRRLARDLGRLTASLHAVPVDADPGWAAFLAKNREGAVARQEQTPYAGAIDAFLDRVPRPEEPHVLLHTELLGEHVFVDDGLQLCGVIDFADGRAGHPLYEVAAFVEFLFGDRDLLTDFFAGWGRPQPDPQELLAWDLLHRYGRLARILDDPPPPSLEAVARRYFA